MANIAFTKRSFAGGEVSPQVLQSCSDRDIYAQGLSQALNTIVLSDGSLVRRPSNHCYSSLRIPPKSRRIISFALGGDKTALFVFGQKKMMIATVNGIKPPQYVRPYDTPYHAYDVEHLDFARMGDLIVLVHSRYPPYQIEFTADDVIFKPMVFEPPPWLGRCQVNGEKHDAKLYIDPLSSTRKGKMTVKSTSPLFKESDVGRMLRLGWLPKNWKEKTLYPENAFIEMFGKVYQSITGGVSGDEWKDNPRDTYIKDGKVTWKVIASSQELSTGKDGKPILGTGGKYRTPYYVWGEIVAVNGKKSAVIRLHKDFCVTDESETSFWNFSAWGENEGYPAHVSFYNNRLCFSGSEYDPQSLYLSGYNTFNDFSPDTIEGNLDYRKALSVAITDDAMSEIRWFRPMEKGLVVGTDTSLWIVILDFERGFNLVSRRLAGIGVYDAPPLTIRDELFFVQGAGRKIKRLGGASEQGFRFLELTQYVSHLFTYRVKQMVYQEDPNSLLWVLNNNNELLCCSVHEDFKAIGSWHVHKLLGEGIKIVSLSSAVSEDQGETVLWMLVVRTDEHDIKSTHLEKLGDFSLNIGGIN
ncbi:hypothetical protein HUT03_02115 [Candidatus Liberibacter africanus]|uniref:hypothetical protein n=1 Tax=Liberibacter africanus TaxID=34020 RepID=UPI001AEB518D|nr:hypothetical protein [Candidatus Liberibacter africanus]QTP63880.1 hypothetical protein HUT03_02115 [Candidatus Liberibacter africanus]